MWPPSPAFSAGTVPGCGLEWVRCWSWWASTPTFMPIATRTSCRAGRRSGSVWPGPWPGTRPVLLMDEPFGAVDPIARDRLQQEFLRLQAQLHKTVILVTHDVDEAVTMGDRIAVLSQGGVLQQYDTPAEVLGHPATPFVADFIGADRGLRRLAVTPIELTDLYTPPVVHPRTTVEEAETAVLAEGTHWAVVVGDDGRLLGWVDPCPAPDGSRPRTQRSRWRATCARWQQGSPWRRR